MKAQVTVNSMVGQIVAQHPETQRVFEDFNIDYCCGGERTLQQAAAEKGVTASVILRTLHDAIQSEDAVREAHNWPEMSPAELAEYIEQRHHAYLRTNLPRLGKLMAKVRKAHSVHHGAMLAMLDQTFDQLVAEIELHMAKEEQALFPFIRQAEEHTRGGRADTSVAFDGVQHPIKQMRKEHDAVGAALAKMRALTNNYELPEDGCQTFKMLYDSLQDLEQDLHQHVHLENNVLFPRLERLEQGVAG